MKVLYALRSSSYIYYHGGVIRHLCGNGHTVHLLLDLVDREDDSTQVLQNLLEEFDGFSFDAMRRRNDYWRGPLFELRELINYARYLTIEDGSTSHLSQYWRKFLPRWMRAVTRPTAVKSILARPSTQHRLRRTERLAPPDPAITHWLRESRPDVVVASPMNWRYAEEAEYVKAANALNIPTVVSVLSWDNLTTKGIFHVIPDTVLVWNNKQFEQASGFPGLSSHRIVITGAPPFDRWFEIERPSLDRTTFCRQVGLDPDKPYVVYLGSAPSIGAPETWLVEELAGCLRASPNDELSNMQVLVRPHPANGKIYQQLSMENVHVWPQKQGLPQTREAMECFYNTLHYGVCAVGLNTSGMIDAIVANKPCVALLRKEYDSTQAGMIHFQTLLQADVFESVNSPAECVDMIARILHGGDSREPIRRRFVEEFIQPVELQMPASQLAARAIEMTALRVNAHEINSDLRRMMAPDGRAAAPMPAALEPVRYAGR